VVLVVDAGQLTGLNEVAAGSQGRIFTAPSVRLDDSWPALYKEFHPHLQSSLDVGALERMIGLPASLGPDVQRWLSEYTAWPAGIVTRNGMVSGLLMRSAPGGLVPAAEFLGGVSVPTDEPALRQSLAEAETLMASLHGWGVTLGPIDARHLLLGRQPACFLLGCDGFRVHGSSILPAAGGPFSPESDRQHFATLSNDLLALATDSAATMPLAYASVSPPAPFAPEAPISPMYGSPYGPQPGRSRNTVGWIIALAALIVLIPIAAVAGVALFRANNRPAVPAASATTAPAPTTQAPTTASSAEPSSTDVATSQPAQPPKVGLVDISAVAGDPRATAVATMFDTYFSAINDKNYDAAVQLYDPNGSINPNDPKQRQTFANGVSTTTDSAASVLSIGPDGSTVPVHITFESHQQAGYGPKGRPDETCTRWDVTYLLSSPSAGQYRIVKATKVTNKPC